MKRHFRAAKDAPTMDSAGRIEAKMSRSEIIERVMASLRSFYSEERYLIDNQVAERTMCGALARHLKRNFRGWHVDPEFNRDGRDPKTLDIGADGKTKRVFPDIAIHRRGPLGPNLVAIEAKPDDERRVPEYERKKLLGYRRKYGYKAALFIALNTGTPFMKWYLGSSRAKNAKAQTSGTGAGRSRNVRTKSHRSR